MFLDVSSNIKVYIKAEKRKDNVQVYEQTVHKISSLSPPQGVNYHIQTRLEDGGTW